MPPENGAYFRTLIERDARHETSLAHWLAGRSSTLHGHSESQVLFRVVCGTLVEERYLPESGGTYRYELETLEAGQESHLPRGAFHQLHCLKDATTIHAFSPPPSDATSPVPPDLVPALEAAKRRLLDPLSTAASTQDQSIVEAVARRVDDWARWEEAQNQNDEAARLRRNARGPSRKAESSRAPVPRELGGWGSSLAETAEAVRQPRATGAGNRAGARHAPGECGHHPHSGRGDSRKACASSWQPAAAGLPSKLQRGGFWLSRIPSRAPVAILAQTRTIADCGADGADRLSGKKSFATLGPDADYFLCAARRVGEGLEGKDVVDGFFVDERRPGLLLDNAWNPLGMRATASVGLTLEETPAACVLGYRGCLEGVNVRHWSTVLFAAVFVGVGEGALAATTDAASRRRKLGVRPGDAGPVPLESRRGRRTARSGCDR